MTRHCDGFRLTRVDSYITHLLRSHPNFPFGKQSETHRLVGTTGNKNYVFCRLRRMTTPRLTVVMLNVVIMTFLFVLFSHGLGLACKSKAALLRSPIPPPVLPVSARGKSVWEFTLGKKNPQVDGTLPLQPSVGFSTFCLFESKLTLKDHLEPLTINMSSTKS